MVPLDQDSSSHGPAWNDDLGSGAVDDRPTRASPSTPGHHTFLHNPLFILAKPWGPSGASFKTCPRKLFLSEFKSREHLALAIHALYPLDAETEFSAANLMYSSATFLRAGRDLSVVSVSLGSASSVYVFRE